MIRKLIASALRKVADKLAAEKKWTPSQCSRQNEYGRQCPRRASVFDHAGLPVCVAHARRR